MKLGDVLTKERQRKKLTVDEVASRLGISSAEYEMMEAGVSPAKEWRPRLALIAIALQTPTSRLIALTGNSKQARETEGQCGKLISSNREKRGLSTKDLADKLGISTADMEAIENGDTPMETCAPTLLSFAEAIDQPIFNLFYPCGLPLDQLTDYP